SSRKACASRKPSRERPRPSNGFNPRRAVRPVRFSSAVVTSKSPCPTNKYGPKNKSNRSARRRQQGLALEVVCRQKRIRQVAQRRPRNPHAAQEETGDGFGAAHRH